MDRYLAMQCFCRVVETGSFAAAARDLDCSRSVVTKYVQVLEDWTQSRLIERTTRTMQLTDAGERFYAYCRRVLTDTDQTLGAIQSATGTVSGRLVVSAPVSLTLSFLADHLHAFQAAHPGVEIEVRLSDRPVDLVKDAVDVALRAQAQLPDSTLIATPLLTLDRTLVATPAYWRRHGKPAHPRELADHNCLPYLLGTDALHWQFHGADGTHVIDVDGGFRSDNSLLLIDAVLRDAGVTLVPTVMIRRELADGRLEPALESFRTESRQLHAVYPSREHLPARVRGFVAFLKGRLGS